MFVPRAVAKKNVANQTHAARKGTIAAGRSLASSSAQHNEPPIPSTNAHTLPRPSASSKISDADLLALLHLSLSDYSIWLDADLRREMEQANSGFVSLSRLIASSTYLNASNPAEASVVKALKSAGENCLLELRILVSSPPDDTWNPYAGTSRTSDQGGFEIRRKDWKHVLKSFASLSKEDWNSRTVYVENFPNGTKSVPRIGQLVSSLLSPEHASVPIIQSISLNPSALNDSDRDNAQDVDTNTSEHITRDRFHGFAFVIFRDLKQVEQITSAWPWKIEEGSMVEKRNELELDTARYGFRTLSRQKWLTLKAEYLEYKTYLLRKTSGSTRDPTFNAQKSDHSRSYGDQPLHSNFETLREPSGASFDAKAPSIPLPYPPGCLVFVKNLHPETNKTTLRDLLSRAFQNSNAVSTKGKEIDYVDYLKGIDTCHIRLAHPSHGVILRDHFLARPISQSSGLDNIGTGETVKPILVEIVEGRKEELYWAKVPDKVKLAAVQKAGLANDESGVGGKRKRRR